MSLDDITRAEAALIECDGCDELQYMFSDGVYVTLDRRTARITEVFVCAKSISEITDDLDAGSGTWEQRRRWYGWLCTHAEEPTGCYLDGDGFKLFVEVYDHAAPDWAETARA